MNPKSFCGLLLLALVLVVSSCGRPSNKRSPKKANNVVTVNNTTTGGACGNGVVDGAEACDSGIASGDGVCPNTCQTPPGTCGTFSLVGSAADCSARCELEPAACQAGDDCCPIGCDAGTDDDCTNICGDGTVEAPEICDGNCPASCDDGDACTIDSTGGSAETCSASCSYAVVTACAGGDGCCPAGCDSGSDSDCSDQCGNGVIDSGETCDGDCPSSCDDGVSCTRDTLSGSAENCSATCVSSPITNCAAGDGCCPAGCTAQTDGDCACAPTTSCQNLGYNCGSLFNGCADISCGTCGGNQVCMNNTCQDTFGIGAACPSGNCDQCIEELTSGWDGGYCTRGCQRTSDCGVGAHCGAQRDDNNNGGCLQNCTTNADCPRAGYECYDLDGDGTRECGPTGTGAGVVGQRCDTYGDCAGGQTASCLLSPSVLRDGYCTRSCTSDNQCGGGAHCSDFGACLANCTTDGDCRGTGYQCYDTDLDGRKECWYAATGAGAVGASCNAIWNCAGGPFGYCLSEDDFGLPGGYCTVLCGPDEGTCAAGSACILPTGSGSELCIDQCVSSSDCRSGYSCTSAGSPSDLVCWL